MTWSEKKAQSIAYLDKYKDQISQEAYDRILQVIGNQAIEDMFMDEQGVKDLIRVENGEITTDELVEEIKQRYQKKWGVAQCLIGLYDYKTVTIRLHEKI